jgi:twitching motility protein PilI
MAKKEALRELQSRLAERLQAARTQEMGKSWLAVECSGRGFLFPLKEAGEIFSPAPVVPVPHSHGWFLGVANLRGHLHGVVDLSSFLGVKTGEPLRDQSRFVVFNALLELNCALVVDRLAGLRSEPQLTVDAEDAGGPRPAFVGQRFKDDSGRPWQELSLAGLANDEAFLRIVS